MILRDIVCLCWREGDRDRERDRIKRQTMSGYVQSAREIGWGWGQRKIIIFQTMSLSFNKTTDLVYGYWWRGGGGGSRGHKNN